MAPVGRKLRVLIIDDDPDFRYLMRKLLELRDFAVVGEAGEGATALLMAGRLQPDAVTLDFRMPGAYGDSVAPELRIASPQVRIIVVSAVLKDRPTWADGFATKDDMNEVVELLAS